MLTLTPFHPQAVPLSKEDHTPQRADELARITAVGANVCPPLSDGESSKEPSSKLLLLDGTLHVTRALGVAKYKGNLPSPQVRNQSLCVE
jgi:hypothetical protein